LKRAGLDYWPAVKIHYHDSFQELQEQYRGHRFFCATTKADRRYTDFTYQDEDFFVFGKETAGLPAHILEAYRETCMRLPMQDAVRALDLANSVAVVLYEGLRQIGFPELY